MPIRWLLFTYKVPAEPAAGRVGMWRRLKGMGAMYLQNGVCLLPRTDDHVRRLKMLENDASEMGGEAVLLETVAFDAARKAGSTRMIGLARTATARAHHGRFGPATSC